MPDLVIRTSGFKYGYPRANNIVDVSFLKNPAREFGLDSVADHRHKNFILQLPQTKNLVLALVGLARVIIAAKDNPVLGICCSSGRHRSPIIADLVATELRREGYDVRVENVDAEKAS